MEVLSIVIEWSLIDNLVTSENKGNSAEIFKKFFLKKSYNLRHIFQFLILDIFLDREVMYWNNDLL
jgi:hypothetical protein